MLLIAVMLNGEILGHTLFDFKEPIIRLRVGKKNLSLRIAVCHHSASLVVLNVDPWDGFFHPTLTLIIDYYITYCCHVDVSVLFLILIMLTVGLQWVNEADLSHTHFDFKEPIIRLRVGKKNLSLRIAVCHHSASLVVVNVDPWDGFFYPTLALIIDYYITYCCHVDPYYADCWFAVGEWGNSRSYSL